MDDLILRVLSGEAGENDKRQLDAWRQASAENERIYREVAEVWRLSAPAGKKGQVPPPPPVAAIVAEAERRRARVIPLTVRRLRRVPAWWWAAAALFVVAAGLGWRWRSVATQVYATAAEQTRTVTLPDGSVVRLGPDSRLRVRKSDPRATELRGVAFFAVATDSARPFVVRTGVGAVQVLGTRFEIRADADSLRVVMIEGRVMLSGAGGRADVTRGHVARIVGRARPTVAAVDDAWALLELPPGVLVFQATPLVDVLNEVSARFGRPFVLRDSALARRTVTATFENEPLEVVMSTVCAVVGVRCVVGDTLKVTGQ